MRDSFEYESNADIIRQLFVPEHIGEPEWSELLANWQQKERAQTLLEYLALNWRDEGTVLEIIVESLNVPVCRNPVYLARHQLDATADMLRNQGFAPLGNVADQRLVTGGAEWDPDLSKYLGSAARSWQWVLVPPVRIHSIAAGLDNRTADLPKESEIAVWLSDLINGLWAAGATDIHFETADDILIVRTHESSRMRTIGEWSDGRSAPILRLLCRWTGISDWDHKRFVDGTLVPAGRNPDSRLRFSLIPTVNGSSIVLRAPAPALYARSLNDLGLPSRLKHMLLDKIRYGSGLILCTGSTGSGKTTTLYGTLNELSHENLKILTIEDPVEQEISHAVQSSLDTINEWTFEKAVHAFLRQDPDVIMIGEIRDAVSAAAACRAALTGHCVLSTMHASSPESAVNRLKNWNIPQSILNEVLKLVIGQRLVRTRSQYRSKPEFTLMKYPERQVSPTSVA